MEGGFSVQRDHQEHRGLWWCERNYNIEPAPSERASVFWEDIDVIGDYQVPTTIQAFLLSHVLESSDL